MLEPQTKLADSRGLGASADSWESWSRRITDLMSANMRSYSAEYLRAYDYGHPFPKFLSDHLGFKFDLRTGEISVPEFLAVLDSANVYIDKLVECGLLLPSEVVRPERVVAVPNAGVVSLPIRSPIPENSAPIMGLLPSSVWTRLFGRGGLAIGEPGMLQPGQSYPEHEIVHMVHLMRYPRAMAAQKLRLFEASEREQLQGKVDKNYERRLYFTVELLQTVPGAAAAPLKKILKLDPAVDCSEVTFAALEKHFRRLNLPELLEVEEGLVTWLLLENDVVGGLYGTPLVPKFGAIYYPRQQRIEAIARTGTFLLRLTELPPDVFSLEALAEQVDPKSKVYALFSDSGVFDGGERFDYWKSVFCRQAA